MQTRIGVAAVLLQVCALCLVPNVLQLTDNDSALMGSNTVAVTVTAAAAGSVIRLNAGGGAFVDNLGQSWVADTPYVVGSAFTYSTGTAITGTVNDPLYQSERYGQSFSYQIPVTNGTYEVALHFAEIYWSGAKQRVFDVTVEGALVINDLDIWSMAGANAALVMPVTATVTDGVLNLAFTTSVDNAKIAAIDVHPSSGGSNQPPTVNAGTDQTITLPTNTVTLTGTASDDGLPSGTLTVAWSTVSGPGTVTFGTPSATTTTATFSSAGTYVLQLSATDTVLTATDPVTVIVNSSSPTNQPPTVNAGADQTITLPTNTVTLTGTASDDGLPSGTLTVAWSTVSGPGTVTFGTPAATTTTATFSSAGTYVLQLSATDTVFTATDTVTVIVTAAAAGSVIRLNAGGGAFVDNLGQSWVADTPYVVGSAFTYSTGTAITGTVNDPLYQSERYGQSFSYQIPVTNGTYEVALHFAEIYWSGAKQRVFDVTVEGALVINDLDIWSMAGANAALVMPVTATVTDGVLNLAFTTSVDNAKIAAIDVHPHASTGDPFLHVVIDAPKFVVDYESAGSVDVALNGSGSHTHEIGHHLASWTWTEGATTLGTTQNIVTSLGLGAHTITLTIADDNTPPRMLTDSAQVDVYPIGAVGGALARYYPAGGTPLAALIDAPPASPGFIEVLTPLEISGAGNKIGGSPFTTNVLAVLTGTFHAATAGSYQFVLQGGSDTRLFLDGGLVNGPVSLNAGAHSLEVRFAIPSSASLPAAILVQLNGGQAVPLDKLNTTHDQSALAPFINSMSGISFSSGGGAITLRGLGFFPSGSVNVVWDGQPIGSAGVVVTPTAISLFAPPGTGTVGVQVQTPNGPSNSAQFTYLQGSGGNISFSTQPVATPTSPTQAAFGPDGRLYVGTLAGDILAYTFDDNYAAIDVQTITAISGLSKNNILGIAFNPFDPPTPVKIYVAHSQLYAQGGSCSSGASPYPGQVSVLTGPDFSSVQPLITGLPTSNHDHAVNGLAFDNEGDLLIAMGGNTNAGVPDCNLGGLPESPLSGSILKARISTPGFNGSISYVETASGAPNNDQVSGHLVDVASGVDVRTFSTGLRNPFDLVWTTRGMVYATDNGADTGFGTASTSATTEAPVADAPDEILSLVEGHYYGHANRNRGRRDARENVYRPPSAGSLLGVHTAQLATVPSSTNGIDEYRSTAFNGALRGNLLVQHWGGALYRAEIAADGLSITSVDAVPGTSTALDVLGGPGGAIIGIDYSGNAINVSQPQGATIGMQAYDIFPWRARPDISVPFVIGGVGFGSLASTAVTIGGVAATITSVSPTRIRGMVPTKAAPTSDLLHVVVQSAGATSVIPGALRYVLPRGVGKGEWQSGPSMPATLAEVAGGVINGVLYLVGEGNFATLAYDLGQHVWFDNLPARPFPGDHHAAEVINGKLYLFGGLHGGSEGKVQIFDPYTQVWTLGADIPFATGSASTALINGKVYLAGGIIGAMTVSSAAVFDPATNSWTSIAPMPQGRNHAAAGTDGIRFYVFGGRGPGSGDGNFEAEGFDDTQIYNPATNIWVSSADAGSTLAPLPQKRGGMGKAAFLGGEFYVIGGETVSSGTGQIPGTNVYNRVDVYNPATNSWRLESVLPTARHGIFPLAYDGKIFVASGGTHAGQSQSEVLEVFSR